METKYHIIEGVILYFLSKKMSAGGTRASSSMKGASPKAGKDYRRAIEIILRNGAQCIIKRYISNKNLS
jgi:hypothetical protein